MNAPDLARTQAPERLSSNLVGGKRRGANDGRTLDVIFPSDGLPVALIPHSGAAEVDAAVASTRAAFDGSGRTTLTQRSIPGVVAVSAARGEG